MQTLRRRNYVFEEIFIFEAARAWGAWCRRIHATLLTHASTHAHTHAHTHKC